MKFVRERQIYDLAVEEKNKGSKIDIIPASYKTSVERNHLRIFISHGRLAAKILDEVNWIWSQSLYQKHKVREIDVGSLHIMDEAGEPIKMNKEITEPENRVLTLQLH